MEKLKGCHPFIFNQDISNRARIVDIFETARPEIVIHMASFPRQKVVNANPQEGAKVMCEGLLNLLEASVKVNVKKFLYISSSMVYGDFKDDVKEDYDCKPQGQYGIMKYMGEKLVADYTRKYPSMNYTIIRPSAVYGELDVEDRVVSKFMLAAMRGQTLKVNGASETLDFTYVEDAADGITAASLSENTANKVYNITKSHSTTLLDAAKLAVKIAGSGTIECHDKDADFPSRGALNIDAARRDFGFSPKVDVEEGFVKYHQWFKTSSYWQKKLAK
jgi:nucleoside-diphosphate-sugar epimerase